MSSFADGIVLTNIAEEVDFPPLDFIEPNAELDAKHEPLCRAKQLVEYYIDTFVFPNALTRSPVMLSANAHDLTALCGTNLGFSGTPNDLAPPDLGPVEYARGHLGQVQGSRWRSPCPPSRRRATSHGFLLAEKLGTRRVRQVDLHASAETSCFKL